MARKRLTQIFPWLLPLRIKQRVLCFYFKMWLDGIEYASLQENEIFPHKLFTTTCPMINRSPGLDPAYQENKVFNLKLAAACLDGLVIRPGETFSFWHALRHADRDTPYRDGLAEVNGKLTAQYGGGLCQMSNLLCWMFLHTPLELEERHGHRTKDFPEPPSDAPMGVDAAVSQGWLDLRFKNSTDTAYQIKIRFDGDDITGEILAERDTGLSYEAVNRNLQYFRKDGAVYERVDVVQRVLVASTGRRLSEKLAYRNQCKIGYPLPAGTPVQEAEPEGGNDDGKETGSGAVWGLLS